MALSPTQSDPINMHGNKIVHFKWDWYIGNFLLFFFCDFKLHNLKMYIRFLFYIQCNFNLNADNLMKVLKVNTVGPAIIGKYFIPLLNKKDKSILAFLSARVGSISDNKTGGWYAYRSSKTALNQIIKNFSIELRRTNPNAIIFGLQPGTVDSNLSEPFKRNVKEGNLFTPDYSVSMLKKIINEASPCNSGSLIAWDGEEIKP